MQTRTIVDEYAREDLKIHINRQLKTEVPDYLRSENGSESTAELTRGWLQRLGVKTLFIERAGPWEHRYIESFNRGHLSDELLNGEIFDTILKARVFPKI